MSIHTVQAVQAVKRSTGRRIGVFLWGLGLSVAAVASPSPPQLLPAAGLPLASQPDFAPGAPAAEAPAAPASQSQAVAPGETPKGITPEAWSRIMTDVQTRTYAVQPDKTGSLLAGNPAQHLKARFSPRDVALTPEQHTRPAPGKHAPRQQQAAPFELRTRSVDGIPAQAVTPVATSNRVEYHHRGYTEWYVNEAKGFEQGWTLDAPAVDGQAAVIRIGVTGARTVAEGPDAIRIEDSHGKLRYRYAGLKVTDAAQRLLPAHLRLAQPGIIEIAVDDRGAQYPVTVDPALTVTQAVTVSATGGTDYYYYGWSVALNGDNLVVGAPISNTSDGTAYIYNRNLGGAGLWGLAATLSDPAGENGGGFGYVVAVNGGTVVVGASDSLDQQGAAYVYSLSQSGTSWELAASLSDPMATAGDDFGSAVAVSGNTVVVGAYAYGTLGAAYIYARNQGGAGAWGKVASLSDPAGAANDGFGSSAAVDGDTVVIGAYSANSVQGAAYVYSRNQGGADAWGLAASLAVPLPTIQYNAFGYAVAVDGDTVVVGRYFDLTQTAGSQEVAAYVYSRNQGGAGRWGLAASLSTPPASSTINGGFDVPVAVAVCGDNVVVGVDGYNTSPGAAYVYNRNQRGAGLWGLVASISDPAATNYDEFGDAVALDGETLVVGSLGFNSHRGAAYIFDIGGGSFTLASRTADPANGSVFGISAAVNGDTVVVGAPATSDSQGTAYIYSRNQGGAGRWGLAASLSDPGATAEDSFGDTVAVDGDVVAVGANGTNNGQGAAYVFSRNQGGAGLWGVAASLNDPGAVSGDGFGKSVAVNGDTLVLGAIGANSGDGAAYVYSRTPSGAGDGSGVWGLAASLGDPAATPGDYFGATVAVNGDTLAVGAQGSLEQQGLAYVYSRNQGGAGQWGLAVRLSDPEAAPSDYFGSSVAVDGDTLAVGSFGFSNELGAAYIYGRNQGGAGAWGKAASLSDPAPTAGASFGYAVTMDGDTVVVGAPELGSQNLCTAYVFSRNQGGAGAWGQVASLSDPAAHKGDNFGDSVSVNGGTVVVGAYGTGSHYEGATYIYSLLTDLPAMLTPASLSFGPQASGSTSAAKTVTLKNSGSGDLLVSGFSFSGTYAADFTVSSNGCGSAVAPGGSCALQVEFSPSGTTPGTLTATLDIASNVPDSPNKIALSGSLSLPPTVTPASLAFGDIVVGKASAARTVTLENHEASALSLRTAISGSGFDISGGTCGSTLAVGKDCTVLVTFTPAALGAVTGTLTLTDSPDINSPHSIALSGTGSTQTTVTPASVAFGSVKVGDTSAVKTVVLENHQTTAINVGTAISGSGFAISGGTCGSTLAAGKDCTVLVTFAPASLGAVTGTLSLSDSPDSASPHSIALSGTGVPQ